MTLAEQFGLYHDDNEKPSKDFNKEVMFSDLCGRKVTLAFVEAGIEGDKNGVRESR